MNPTQLTSVLPSLRLTFSDTSNRNPLTLTLSPISSYLLATDSTSTANQYLYCPGIRSQSTGTLMGWAVMNQFIVIHDIKNAMIGFAPSTQCAKQETAPLYSSPAGRPADCALSSGGLLLVLFGSLGQHLVSPGPWRHREAQTRAAVEIALGDLARNVADAADVGGALGHADGAACIEQIKGVRGLQQLLVGRQGQVLLHQVLGLLFMAGEGQQQELDIGNARSCSSTARPRSGDRRRDS